MNQIQFSFDQKTVEKIIKGALISIAGPAALGLLSFIGTLHFNDPTVAYIAAWAGPALTNLVKEWIAGHPATF